MTTTPTTMFLIRHPQTTWNAISRYQGRQNPPLSPRGEKQRDVVSGLVRPGMFASVYSSPLDRALALASVIAERCAVPLVTDERLVEIAMGPWEGLHRDEIARRFPELFKTWYDRPDYVNFPGGESLKDVSHRVLSFVDFAFQRHCGERIAIVTHDVCVKVAVMASLGIELSRLHGLLIRNASITILHGRELRNAVDAVDVTTHLTGSPFVLPEK